MKKGEVTYCELTIMCPYCDGDIQVSFDVNHQSKARQKPNLVECDEDECQKEFLWEWPF